jgi:hypothetical protein
MQTPKWFYIVIAVCAVALTASEIAYRAHSWNHWEHTADGEVFNPATGVTCHFTSGDKAPAVADTGTVAVAKNTEDLWSCFDRVNGRVIFVHPVIPPSKSN